MASPSFIITIDTEGDNIWSRPERVTTENARYVPRFQNLCEEYGFKPTYLVNYEMAIDPDFQKFGCSLLRRDAGEIGLHVHAWNSPPLTETPYNPRWHHAYLYEFSDEMIYAKIDYLTKLMTNVFDSRPVSYRAGRWGFDERTAQVLSQMGYRVDCSVTPGVSWRSYKGAPDGEGGPDFSGFPAQPYFLDLNNIGREGLSQLLEVPVTIMPNYHPGLQKFYSSIEDGLIGKVFRRVFGPPHAWLRPNGKNIDEMLSLVNRAVQQRLPTLEFMLHSSEFMPGGSPVFKTAEQIELLYEQLRKFFASLASLDIHGMTMKEYRSTRDESPGVSNNKVEAES